MFYYTILHQLPEGVIQISMEDLVYKEKFPGKIFNLDMNDIYDMANILENKNYIKFNRRYGGDYIEIIETNKENVLEIYYLDYKID